MTAEPVGRSATDRERRLLVGIDVGGTFTDLIALDTSSGELWTCKVPSTLDNQADGFLSAFDAAGLEPADAALIVHGTTTGTNAILERKGGRAGLITTRGFRDSLELGRRHRPNLWGLYGSFEPLIPRNLRLEVDERMNAQGTVVRPLSDGDVSEAVRQLLEAGCESVALCFLHAHRSDDHERRAAEIVRELWPNEYVSISSEVLPEMREFERATATALNAMLQPLVTSYLGALTDRLEARGYDRPLLVTQGDGGVLDARQAGRRPVRLLLSGPAAGVSAASAIAAQAGFPNAISADMGGTSLDVALIRDGSATLTYESEIDEGVPIRSPMTDIKTVGAGGGSLAYVDRQGLLRVGPESAGSTPGPVCYGRGGTRPTITDANLWLGRLDVARIPGVTDHGGVLAAVEIAIRTHVADPLGMSVDEAAVAIITIANHTLAMAIRLVSIERGVDPRDLALIPFGGAASLHAIAWARELSIPTVLVPLRPGVTSALGCLVADIEQELVRSHPVALDALDPGELEAIVEDLAAQGRAVIDEQRIAYERVSTLVTLDLQYEGQFHVFHLDFGELPRSREMIAARFQEAYSEHYGLVLEGMRALLVNVRVHVTAHRPDVDVTSVTRRNGHRRPRRTRSVWTDVGREEVEVIDRMTLADGDAVAGPAVLEQDDTTIYLPAGTHGHVDGAGNLVLDAGRAA